MQLVINGISAGCIYGLIALGFVLIYKATEMVNFAQGDLMMLGAFAGFTLIGVLGLPYWLGFLLSVAVLAVFGFVLDAVVVRRVLGRPAFAGILVTIGVGFVLRAAAGVVWGYDPVSFSTPFTGRVVRHGVWTVPLENLAVIVGTVLLCVILLLFFRLTRLGLAMQAASQNQLAAYSVGIPVQTVFSLTWALSAGVAAVAGILLAPIALVDVGMGFLGIKAFAVAVLGGFGSIPGALVGGVIIGNVEQLAGAYLPAGFQDAAAYLILLLVLAVRPHGIFAQESRKKV